MMYERRIKTVKSLWDRFKISIEYLKVKNYEKKCTKLFKLQTVISDTDKKYLSEFANTKNVAIIGNGVDTNYYQAQNATKENNICFVGSMQYIPNSEAAMYFATEIFPLIKKEIPNAKFKIIGANPRQELFDATKNIADIVITGRVDDVREYMKDCKVSVCPVKIAGGIQNKILEAMAMEMPVVTTPEGAEGINADENILTVAKTNEEYAQKVIHLLQNDCLQEKNGKQSRDFVINHFSWESVGQNINYILNNLMEQIR